MGGVLIAEGVSTEKFEEIITRLRALGNIEEIHKNSVKQLYRLRFGGAFVTLTYFPTKEKVMIQGKGSILNKLNETLISIFDAISIVPPTTPSYDDFQLNGQFLVGIDESGAGETFGPLVVGAVLLSRDVLTELSNILPTRIKDLPSTRINKLYEEVKRRAQIFWKEISAQELDERDRIIAEDDAVKTILEQITSDLSPELLSIVIDDYGSKTLREYLKTLEAKGAEVVLRTKADDTFVCVKAASVVARKFRLAKLREIDAVWGIPTSSGEIVYPGSGSPSNENTKRWLIAFRQNFPYSEFPSFVRKTWKNVREIEKLYPRKTLEGIYCPYCNAELRIIDMKLVGKQVVIVCPKCKREFSHDVFSLKNVAVLPDTSALVSRALSKDLGTKGYFKNTLILLPLIIYNADLEGKSRDIRKGFENEMNALKEFEKKKVIRLKYIYEAHAGDNKYARDIELIRLASIYKAVLLTKDHTLAAESQNSVLTVRIL